MNIIGLFKCLINGHKVETSESIVQDYMLNPRNWLCKCKNCGLYVMHDGAISGKSVLLTERSALKTKQEFIDEAINIQRMIYDDQKTD